MAITVQPTKLINTTPTLTQGKAQVTSFVNNSFTSDTNGGVQFPLQQGVPMQTIYQYNVIPAAASQICVVTTVAADFSGVVTLNASSTSTTGKLVNNVATAFSYVGQPIILPSTTVSSVETFPGFASPGFTGGAIPNVIQLDCERGLGFFFASQPTTTSYITIGGWDYRGVAVSEQLTITSGSELEVNSRQMYSIIGFIYVSSSTVDVEFTVGTSGTFGYSIGLPYVCNSIASIIQLDWGVTDEVINTEFIAPNIWRSATSGEANNTPSLSTALSARGYIVLPSIPNGNTQLSVTYFVYGADSETNANIANLNPSALGLYSISTNVGGNYVWPYLVPQDLVGMQYPGDNAVFAAYTAALAITTTA